MKKYLLLLFFLFLAAPHCIKAQCVPDLSITQPGIYPDSLPAATVGTPYSQVLQVKVITDTITPLGQATIDSIKIVGITGIPAGFTYSCVPTNCVFPGGSNGCIAFSGLATTGQEGSYPISITIDVTGTVLVLGFPVQQTQQETINDYTFVVNAGTVSVQNIKSNKPELMQNFPNPAITKTAIEYVVTNASIAEFTVYNVLGRQILNKKYSARQGKNTIELDVRDFEDGIYMYTLKAGNTVMTRRMVISKKQ